MTECTPAEIRTKAPGRRDFVARFDGGDITTDGGVLLFQAVEEKRSILKRFAECFTDHRDSSRVEHTVTQLVSQRVLAIALGYEDVNDHDRLRLDPLLASVVGKIDPKGSSRKRQADSGLAKEQQLDLFADRTSCHLFRANQVRLYLSSLAYVMMSELRRIGLAGTELAQAQCGTIRTRLLKIGARVRVTARNIWVSMSESYPLQDLLMQAWHRVAYG